MRLSRFAGDEFSSDRSGGCWCAAFGRI